MERQTGRLVDDSGADHRCEARTGDTAAWESGSGADRSTPRISAPMWTERGETSMIPAILRCRAENADRRAARCPVHTSAAFRHQRTRATEHEQATPLNAEVVSIRELASPTACHHCGAPVGPESSRILYRARQCRYAAIPAAPQSRRSPTPDSTPGTACARTPTHKAPPPPIPVTEQRWTRGACPRWRQVCCEADPMARKGRAPGAMTTTPPPSPSPSRACVAPGAHGSSSASSHRLRG